MKTNYLLRIKNWQLFCLIFFVPIAFTTIYGLAMRFFNFNSTGLFDNPLPTIIYGILFIAWNFSVIKKLDETDKILTEKNKKLLKFILLYLCLYLVYILGPALDLFTINFQFILWKGLSFLSHFVMFLSLVTLVYYSAKAIKYRQLNVKTRTSDIFIEMLIIFYFPLGLWWLQPRLNKFVMQTKKQSTNR